MYTTWLTHLWQVQFACCSAGKSPREDSSEVKRPSSLLSDIKRVNFIRNSTDRRNKQQRVSFYRFPSHRSLSQMVQSASSAASSAGLFYSTFLPQTPCVIRSRYNAVSFTISSFNVRLLLALFTKLSHFQIRITPYSGPHLRLPTQEMKCHLLLDFGLWLDFKGQKLVSPPPSL